LPLLDGKYQLIRQLGEGGMGAVFEARHTGTGRRVAVKVIAGEALAKGKDAVARFQREAMASGAIESQYIAHVLDTGIDPASGSPYLVMELLVGDDLEQTLARLGPLAPEVALRVAAQACLGLQKAHEAGVIHRDIKPANIFLTRLDGGETLVKVLDFGIAKMRGAETTSESKSLTRTGSMIGSPVYMSPEQAYGKKTIDHRTDVWSIGVVLYEMLGGITPHSDAETVGELIVRICSTPPALVQQAAPWVPPEVASIVHRALALDPAARFATAGDMYKAIRALLPTGHALDQTMFVPLPPHVRAAHAPLVSLPGAVRVPAPSASDLSRFATAGAGGPLSGRTTAGLSSTGETDIDEPAAGVPKGRSVVPLLFAGITLVAGLGLGVLGYNARARATTAPAALVASSPAPEPSATAAPIRTVRLVVLPAAAKVEVDGVVEKAVGGAVALTGAVGTTHHVRLSLWGRERTADVVIGDEGPSPALLDLAAGSPRGGAPHSAAKTTVATNGPGTGSPAPAAANPSAQAQASSAVPPPTPAAPAPAAEPPAAAPAPSEATAEPKKNPLEMGMK
jgi:serine/threonine-protein kinase